MRTIVACCTVLLKKGIGILVIAQVFVATAGDS